MLMIHTSIVYSKYVVVVYTLVEEDIKKMNYFTNILDFSRNHNSKIIQREEK